jgi:hypothetical protein
LKTRQFALGLALLLAATNAWSGIKVAVAGKAFESKSGSYAIEFPAGWKYDSYGMNCAASRDGFNLNAVAVEIRKHKNAFKAIKKNSSEQSLPQELAEDFVANMKAAGGNEGIEVLENDPVDLAGKPGFRLHLKYRVLIDVGALDYEHIIVGAVTPKGLLLVGYRAPSLHYFAAQRTAFDAALASFRFASAK